MATIVAARFETEQEARRAMAALADAGIRRDKLTNFGVLPPGQHAMHPIGGDALHDRGTRKSGRGAAIGIAGGALLGAVGGWLVGVALPFDAGALGFSSVVGAAVGAAIGSFIGALAGMRQPNASRATVAEPVSRKSGPLVAAEVGDHPEQHAAACDAFVGLDAFEIEEADGTIRNGDWIDFDPRIPPRVIVPTQRSAAANTISRRRRERAPA